MLCRTLGAADLRGLAGLTFDVLYPRDQSVKTWIYAGSLPYAGIRRLGASQLRRGVV